MMFRLVLLSGFLGAGKTTTMLAAARLLGERGHRVAVVTNDQGDDLVDTHLATGSLLAELVGEVTGGCFCCRFEDLAETVRGIVANSGADTVIAEAVGSCTDLQATVIRPLRRHYRGGELEVAPLTTVVEPVRIAAMARTDADPDLAYLFDRQLAEADIIGLNKVEAHRPEIVTRLADQLRARYPYARVVPYSAATRVGDLVDAWSIPAVREWDVPVDYDRYATAEARLGWLNIGVRVEAPHGFAPPRWAVAALTELSAAAERGGHLIGHAKLTIRTVAGLTKASLVAAGAPAVVDRAGAEHATGGDVTVNVRMACSPGELGALVERAIWRADQEIGTSSRPGNGKAFTPAYPRPVHRIGAQQG